MPRSEVDRSARKPGMSRQAGSDRRSSTTSISPTFRTDTPSLLMVIWNPNGLDSAPKPSTRCLAMRSGRATLDTLLFSRDQASVFFFGKERERGKGMEEQSWSLVLLPFGVCHTPWHILTYGFVRLPYDPIGPIWSRSHATQEDGMEETCKRVDAVKKALGVSTIPGQGFQRHSSSSLH